MNEYLSAPSAPEEKKPEERAPSAPPARDMRGALKSRCATGRGAVLTLCSLLLAMLFCDGVLLSSAGISMPLCVLGYQALVRMIFHTHPDRDSRRMRRARRLAVPILILPLGHLLHYNPSTRWVATLTMFVLCALQLAVLGGAGVENPFSAAALCALPERLIVSPLVSLDLPFASLGALKNTRSASMRRAAAAALGVVLALPVGILLLALFSHADALFADALSRFFRALHLNVFSLYLDLLFGGMGGLLLAAGLLGARYDTPDVPKPAAPRKRVPAAVCCAFLTVVDAITALFVAFQFVYLFGGESAVYGMTWAEYARRGFFELCAASGMVFAVSLLALLLSRPSKAVRVLTAVLAACDLVVLASALRRMLLYVDAYGMSVRRLLTLWGMAVVAVCLVLLLVRCVRERFDVVRFLSLTAVTGVCLLSLANTDGLAAAWNVRAIAQGTLTETSLRGLSYSAAAAVARGGYGEDVLSPMRAELEGRHPLYSFCLDDIAARLAFREAGGRA